MEDGNNIDIKTNSSHLSFDLITFKSADCAKFLSSFNFATQKVYSPIQTYFIDAILNKVLQFIAKDSHYEHALSLLVQELS